MEMEEERPFMSERFSLLYASKWRMVLMVWRPSRVVRLRHLRRESFLSDVRNERGVVSDMEVHERSRVVILGQCWRGVKFVIL